MKRHLDVKPWHQKLTCIRVKEFAISRLPQNFLLSFFGYIHTVRINQQPDSATRGQCYKTSYHGNLLPFHGNYQGNIALSHRIMVLPWNDSKLPW